MACLYCNEIFRNHKWFGLSSVYFLKSNFIFKGLMCSPQGLQSSGKDDISSGPSG